MDFDWEINFEKWEFNMLNREMTFYRLGSKLCEMTFLKN